MGKLTIVKMGDYFRRQAVCAFGEKSRLSLESFEERVTLVRERNISNYTSLQTS